MDSQPPHKVRRLGAALEIASAPSETSSALQFVPDDMTDQEHQDMDEAIFGHCASYKFTPRTFTEIIGVVIVIYHTVKTCPAKLNIRYTDLDAVEELVSQNPQLSDVVQAGFNSGTFRQLRRLAILRSTGGQDDNLYLPHGSGLVIDRATARATVKSWETEYRGQASTVFYDTLCMHLQVTSHYARNLTIVQSSGTGKSRLNDELAKRVVSVDVNLGNPEAHAFPPCDREVRKWFDIPSRPKIREETTLKCQAFPYGVLVVALECLQIIASENGTLKLHGNSRQDMIDRSEKLAAAFRSRMAEDRTFAEHGRYRRLFYRRVLDEADQFTSHSKKSNDSEKSPKYTINLPGHPSDVLVAGQDLLNFLDPHRVSRVDDSPAKHSAPLFVLSFDEAHETTLASDSQGVVWSLFSEIRRALRLLRDLPFFAVFLATGGGFHHFSPNPMDELSNRLQSHALNLFPPVTETGFDELAPKVRPGTLTLEEVVQDGFISHLGCALFATRYDVGDTGVQSSIVDFAAQKLICSGNLKSNLSDDQQLACLAVRLPLEFRATAWSDRGPERRQVERHMRICLAASAGFESMVTVAASEPILAEGASKIMRVRMSAPRALLHHLHASHLAVGERGEQIAALILLLTRDSAAARKMKMATQSHRILSVQEYLQALLPEDEFQAVWNAHPARFSEDEDKPMSESFADAKIWFNHFIKVTDFSVVSQVMLWRLMVRGAAIVCANNMRGYDILLPVLYRTGPLGPWQMTAILVSVKNDKSFTAKVKQGLFTSMNPRNTGVVSDGRPALPVIRLVMALAAPENGARISVVKPGGRRSPRLKEKFDTYTAYDI